MSRLLARYAQAMFWMGRQIERVDNLSRILDVTESFSRGRPGEQDWESVPKLFADDQVFAARGLEANAVNVLNFYILDRANPNSVVMLIDAARENARTLRPLISTEMWAQLNVFHGRIRGLRSADLAEPSLNRLSSFIKEGCQTHSGITAETLYRDEGWLFCQMGVCIERADQTTRLVDACHHIFTPAADPATAALDSSRWNVLLRSAAGYHAYRRVHPSGMSASRVAGFLIMDLRFPRSVACCAGEARRMLAALHDDYGITSGAGAARLNGFVEWLARETIEGMIARGLHAILDEMQIELRAVTDDLGRAFFGLAR